MYKFKTDLGMAYTYAFSFPDCARPQPQTQNGAVQVCFTTQVEDTIFDSLQERGECYNESDVVLCIIN